MLKIQLVRHGRTYGNSLGRYIGTTDEPLLAEETVRLKKIKLDPVDVVFASPMIRCIETAKLLFPKQNLIPLDALRECDFGEFENKNYQELSGNAMYQKWIDSDGTIGFPGGETQLEFQSRCLKGFDEVLSLCRKNKTECAALIVHGGTIMSIMEAYGIPAAGYFDWQVKNGEGYKVRMQPELWDVGIKELIVVEKIMEESDDVR